MVLSRQLVCIVATIVLLCSPLCGYGSAGEEIAHLLHFVEKSGCVFIRNGKEYGPWQAREHMERKYSHIRSRVKTAEQFIKYAATQSSISGKHYSVRCEGKTIPSAKWLQNELARFRSGQGS